MSHKVTNKEREYILKVLNETLEYENEEKFVCNGGRCFAYGL